MSERKVDKVEYALRDLFDEFSGGPEKSEDLVFQTLPELVDIVTDHLDLLHEMKSMGVIDESSAYIQHGL